MTLHAELSLRALKPGGKEEEAQGGFIQIAISNSVPSAWTSQVCADPLLRFLDDASAVRLSSYLHGIVFICVSHSTHFSAGAFYLVFSR